LNVSYNENSGAGAPIEMGMIKDYLAEAKLKLKDGLFTCLLISILRCK
jgi:hypothetical protein